MFTRHSLVSAAALALAMFLAPSSRAEVAAETDAYGNYVRTTVLTQSSVRHLRVWKVLRHHVAGVYALNPEGDRNGDLAPVIAENPVDGNLPWVVWSRFNGTDYDLAWSRWLPGAWTPIRRVDDLLAPGDDLGPRLVFDGTGRPLLTWWRDEDGVGRVYLSLFLVTRWMPPLLVSDPEVDSRNPRLGVQEDGSVRVEFDTPQGPETRVVLLALPATITDDLDPVGQASMRKGPR